MISHADMFMFEKYSYKETGEDDFDFSEIKADDPATIKILKQMVRKGVILDVTLFVERSSATEPGGEEMFQYCLDITRKAHELGVTIVAGTDDLGGPDQYYLPNLFEEIEMYVDYCGITPLEAITSATLIGAKTMGIEKTHGTLGKGKKANRVILNANPAKNIRNARKIEVVIKNGKFYKRSLYSPIPIKFNMPSMPPRPKEKEEEEKKNEK